MVSLSNIYWPGLQKIAWFITIFFRGVGLNHQPDVVFSIQAAEAFPFDQQKLKVILASEKLMADELVPGPLGV